MTLRAGMVVTGIEPGGDFTVLRFAGDRVLALRNDEVKPGAIVAEAKKEGSVVGITFQDGARMVVLRALKEHE